MSKRLELCGLYVVKHPALEAETVVVTIIPIVGTGHCGSAIVVVTEPPPVQNPLLLAGVTALESTLHAIADRKHDNDTVGDDNRHKKRRRTDVFRPKIMVDGEEKREEKRHSAVCLPNSFQEKLGELRFFFSDVHWRIFSLV